MSLPTSGTARFGAGLFLFVHVPIYSVTRGKLHKINHMWSELGRSKDVNLSGLKK